MRKLFVLSLLCGSLIYAQNKPSPKNQSDAENGPAAAVAPDAPVLTVKGLCPHGSAPADPCQTIVTRAQFENLINAIQPHMDDDGKRKLAHAYPQYLIMEQEADQRGLDKTQRYQERIDFARLQILSQELTRQIEDQAAEVPEKEIEDYYQKNSANFETANLERVIVPLRAESDKMSADDLKKKADEIRAQAAAGADFAKLQKAAYDAAGVSGNTAPSPTLHDMRRRSLPLTQASVFDLKPGEVSRVITDGTGHYIYKMDSNGMVPLSSADHEIRVVLTQQRARKMIETVLQPFNTDVNTAYFGAGGKDKDKD
jgi:hypothetical protein